MKKIQDVELQEGAKVILRVDFNVALENGAPKELFKLEACKESLDFLLQKKCKVALMTYFGRPEGKVVPEMSLRQMSDDLEKILDCPIKFIDDCHGDKVRNGLAELKEGEVLLLENVRFYPGEENNDPVFSSQLAENFDVFINEAFSQSHRNQASVTGITKFLPSCAGFWLQKEIENLDKVKNNPEQPAVAIIGGAKIETKLPLIQSFEKSYNNILVGGKIANECIDQGLRFSDKVSLPIDYAKDRFDIGTETIKKFRNIILKAKTIVWNGPLGKFEEEPYNFGTDEILQAVVESGAFSVMGGGESVEVLESGEAMGKISFVSTGGGAMLEYMSGGKLPGIEALK